MRPLVTLSRLACVLILSGCAGVNVTPVSNEEQDLAADGFRYYETATFLIVYADGKGGITSELKQVCDTTRKRAIDPYGVMAKNDLTLSFDHGCLKGEKTDIDETVVPKALVSAVQAAVVAAAPLLDKAQAEGTTGPRVANIPAPLIYRLTVENGYVVLRGGTSNPDIRVTVTQPETGEQSK